DCAPLWFGELEAAVLSNTPMWWLMPSGLDHIPHYERILGAFEFIEREMPSRANPRFVFVHVAAPHPPFVIHEDGSFVPVDRIFTGGGVSVFGGTGSEYRF